MTRQEFHLVLERFEARLPQAMARASRWLRRPGSWLIRYPAAAFLIVGGVLGFLPILGFWMVPLGLLLIAIDWPLLRPPLARLLRWVERKWPQRKSAGADLRRNNTDPG